MPPLNKLSQPVPVPGKPKPVFYDPEETLHITKADRKRLEKQLARDHGGKIVPVWLGDDTNNNDEDFELKDQSRWRTYAKRELYTMFHYKQNEPTNGKAARLAWADYYKMNSLFCDRIVEIYKPGDIINVHDYSLMLLPSLLRQKIPSAYIAYFHHVPFPSSEHYRCLSMRKEIMEGVMGANIIAFQSSNYARHFESCCSRLLGYQAKDGAVDVYGTHIAIDAIPIGIDAHATERCAFQDPKVDDIVKNIKELYAGKKIIIGRDRLDATRGITQKLQAFELYLQRFPDMGDKVVLIQITSPNAMNTGGKEGEAQANQSLAALAAKINGKYGTLGHEPVRLFPHYLDREEYFALLRVADAALITSVRDGMNTTSLEFAICQKDNHAPLILSEFSGTASSLTSAISVNPWDFSTVADAINTALIMSDKDRKERAEKSYNRVLTHNVQNWTDLFIQALMKNVFKYKQMDATPVVDRANMLHVYREAERRIFMFDYDGTLTPIVEDANAAIPSDRVIRSLKLLASDPKNSVWIISGRDQLFLEQWMGHITDLGLSAEHGCFMRRPREDEWENVSEKMDMSWREKVEAVFQKYTEKTAGSFIERKKVALTWHYRRSDPQLGFAQAQAAKKELENGLAMQYDVEVMTGKANLEVRPKFINKGEIAKTLIEEYGKGRGNMPDFVFCTGDDTTDEGKLDPLFGFDYLLTRQPRYVPSYPRLRPPRRLNFHGHSRCIVEANLGFLASSGSRRRRQRDRVVQRRYRHRQHRRRLCRRRCGPG